MTLISEAPSQSRSLTSGHLPLPGTSPGDQQTGNAYDEVPYEGWSYAHTHPSILATAAAMRGLEPAPVQTCRVLEIGCAAGYNIIPMAMGLPDAEFVGIDYSPTQISEGRDILVDLGVENVSLYTMDIQQWDVELGQFDYIIAHGIYSWVPEPVREKLMGLVRTALRPNGIAYVSYNTYPGWHMLESLRSMMLYHIRNERSPEVKVQKARELIELLVSASDVDNLPHGTFQYAFRSLVKGYYYGVMGQDGKTDSLFLHDELEEVNAPCYFHEFVAHADQYGLQYLGDSEFSTMIASGLPAETMEKLYGIVGSSLEMEQYLDFLRNRTFRRALLCHGDQSLAANMTSQTLERLRFRSEALPQVVSPSEKVKNGNTNGHGQNADQINANGTESREAENNGIKNSEAVNSESVNNEAVNNEIVNKEIGGEALDASAARPVNLVKFVSTDGASLSTDHPVSIVAMNRMGRTFPRTYTLDDLLDIGYRELSESNPDKADSLQKAARGEDLAQRSKDRRVLANTLTQGFCSSSRLVEFTVAPGCMATELGECPMIFEWARWQARSRDTVANPMLRRVTLDPIARFLVVRMDGTRSRDDLVRAVINGPVRDGLWRAEVQEVADDSQQSLEAVVTRTVQDRLDFLLRAGLLVESEE